MAVPVRSGEIACASLITRRAAFGTYGSFSAKFAASAANAPFLEDPVLFAGKPGTYRLPELTEGRGHLLLGPQ